MRTYTKISVFALLTICLVTFGMFGATRAALTPADAHPHTMSGKSISICGASLYADKLQCGYEGGQLVCVTAVGHVRLTVPKLGPNVGFCATGSAAKYEPAPPAPSQKYESWLRLIQIPRLGSEPHAPQTISSTGCIVFNDKVSITFYHRAKPFNVQSMTYRPIPSQHGGIVSYTLFDSPEEVSIVFGRPKATHLKAVPGRRNRPTGSIRNG
jgi:hypothetical protein